MIQEKILQVQFDVDNYVEISDFSDVLKGGMDLSTLASIIGCIEGIIEPSIDNSSYIFAGIHKITCKEKNSFLCLHNFIKKNEKVRNYIIEYFNLWHNKKYEEFTYDQYNKNDLYNNYCKLASFLWNENHMRENIINIKEAEAYKSFYEHLYKLTLSCMICK